MNSFRLHTMRSPRQREEDPLNLRSLPLVDPPRDAWPEIEAELLRRSGRQRALQISGGALAAAAAVTLAVGLYFAAPAETPAPGQANTALATAQHATPTPDGPADAGDQLDSLIAVSQQLEGRLRLLRREVGDMPSRDLVYQVELQDLVVQVDDALSMNPDSVPLWNQRVNLLADLNTLYEDRLRREYRQMASL
jgi:hypothetical protein